MKHSNAHRRTIRERSCSDASTAACRLILPLQKTHLSVAKTKLDCEISEIAAVPFSPIITFCCYEMIECFTSFLRVFIGSAPFPHTRNQVEHLLQIQVLGQDCAANYSSKFNGL
jgi:hypothetical protein